MSATGLDSNACGRTAPCRSFTVALEFTDVDGEVIVLDSAGYGSVTITQPVSITTPTGVYAGITASANSGIIVSLGFGTDRVMLSGLTLNGIAGTTGISMGTAGNLMLEDLTINGFSQAISASGGSLAVHNCAIRGSRTDSNSIGVSVDGNVPANALIENSRIEVAGVGLLAGLNSRVALIDSYVAYCTTAGLRAQAGGILNVERTTIVHSGTAVSTLCNSGSPAVRLSNSTIVNNLAGVNACATSIVFTRTNNTIVGNNNDFPGSAMAPLSAQ